MDKNYVTLSTVSTFENLCQIFHNLIVMVDGPKLDNPIYCLPHDLYSFCSFSLPWHYLTKKIFAS